MLNRKTALLLVAFHACLGVTIARCAEKLNEDKIRVLVITGGHDYEVPQFNAMFDAIPDITTEQATLPDAAALLKPELADKFDVVVLYDMWVGGIHTGTAAGIRGVAQSWDRLGGLAPHARRTPGVARVRQDHRRQVLGAATDRRWPDRAGVRVLPR